MNNMKANIHKQTKAICSLALRLIYDGGLGSDGMLSPSQKYLSEYVKRHYEMTSLMILNGSPSGVMSIRTHLDIHSQ